MTDKELAEHLGEYVVCTSKRCTNRNRLTVLGELWGKPPALVTACPITGEQDGTLELGSPTTGYPVAFADRPAERGHLPLGGMRVIYLTSRVTCWHCGQIKSLKHLSPSDFARG